jgi:hypothetical protein
LFENLYVHFSGIYLIEIHHYKIFVLWIVVGFYIVYDRISRITYIFGSIVAFSQVNFTPEQFLSYKIGAQFTRQDKVVAYFNELQKAFDDFYNLLKINNRVKQLMEQKIEKRYHIKIKEMTASVLCKQLHLKHAIIVHDKQDKIIPFHNAEIVAKNLKNCQLIPIENAGHYKILWDKRVIDLVDKEITV